MKKIDNVNNEGTDKRPQGDATAPLVSQGESREEIRKLWIEGKRSKGARGIVPCRPLPKDELRIKLWFERIQENSREYPCVYSMAEAEAESHIEAYTKLYLNDEGGNEGGGEGAALEMKMTLNDKPTDAVAEQKPTTEQKRATRVPLTPTRKKKKKKKADLFDPLDGLLY
jgi:hypothetical protein